MVVYLVMLVLSCFGGWLSTKMKDSNGKIFAFTLTFIPLFLVSGLRFEVGQDYTTTYVYTFERILNGYSNIRMDLGFFYLNKLVAFFSGSSQWIFVITSFIINYYICKSIFEKSSNKFLSIFIYICGTLFFFSLNGVRQAIAMSLFYYSLKYIEEKNLKKYFITNLVGFLFHNSAIIFFPLYFILNKRFKTTIKIAIIGIMIFISPLLLNYISRILLSTKYAMYITNGAYSPLEFINVSTVINILLFALYELYYRKQEKNDSRYNIYSNIHFIGILVSVFMTKISLVIRIFMYFRYIEFLSVPYLLSKIKMNKKLYYIVVIVVLITYFVYFIHGVYIENGNTVLPYHSIFS